MFQPSKDHFQVRLKNKITCINIWLKMLKYVCGTIGNKKLNLNGMHSCKKYKILQFYKQKKVKRIKILIQTKNLNKYFHTDRVTLFVEFRFQYYNFYIFSTMHTIHIKFCFKFLLPIVPFKQ